MRRSLAQVGRAVALGGMLAATAGAGSALAAVCARPAEREALDARVLQTELIVAALSCGENKRYKAFVGRFEEELIKRAAFMKKYFARSHSGSAKKEMNEFVTSLANEASQRSLTEAGSFCANAAALFEAVLKVEPAEFVQFATARPSTSSHGVPLCGEVKKAAARSGAGPVAKILTKPRPKPARSEAGSTEQAAAQPPAQAPKQAQAAAQPPAQAPKQAQAAAQSPAPAAAPQQGQASAQPPAQAPEQEQEQDATRTAANRAPAARKGSGS